MREQNWEFAPMILHSLISVFNHACLNLHWSKSNNICVKYDPASSTSSGSERNHHVSLHCTLHFAQFCQCFYILILKKIVLNPFKLINNSYQKTDQVLTQCGRCSSHPLSIPVISVKGRGESGANSSCLQIREGYTLGRTPFYRWAKTKKNSHSYSHLLE